MTGIAGDCARATSGHAAPPRSAINSRRFMLIPQPLEGILSIQFGELEEAQYVGFGSLADICSCTSHVRFAPNSSALGQKSTSDEHSIARQNHFDFGELARLRIDLD